MPDFFDDRDDGDDDRKYKRYKSRRRKSGTRLGLVVHGLILIALGYLFIDILQDQKRYELLLQEGALTTGVVTDKDDHRPNRLILSGGRNSSYRVEYQYTVLVNGSPTQLETRTSVARVNYSKYQVGAKIEVVYLPSAPETSEPKIDFAPPSVWGYLFILTFIGIVAYSGVMEMKAYARLKEAFRD